MRRTKNDLNTINNGAHCSAGPPQHQRTNAMLDEVVKWNLGGGYRTAAGRYIRSLNQYISARKKRFGDSYTITRGQEIHEPMPKKLVFKDD
ncbi:uncharacterized protein PHALS_10042 [Plasmopara halstedii]|uniref:Uncharacterized protein n=1 Tax=Plasmopara halstedii TaxID=4781 RepID=A0A0P1AFD7_PLAHL|nr:uncharacterized protein PHALS_10042 [Plasmopara halstedii]CEG39807.1 hypothetical protein PHALS_10042 [Plasmopara halstedii]|eukprot:XP_024576176.1 hypothetical protein PHALS_10042 [Plasmopara halstedii]